MSIKENRIHIGDAVVERYIYDKQLQWDAAREVYDQVKEKISRDFKGVPAFEEYFEYNEGDIQIQGSSTLYGILVNEVLSEKGLWLPTIAYAKKMDADGLLSNGVYRNYGLAIYNKRNPNKKVSIRLANQAKERGWDFPVLTSFKNLKIEKGDDLLGVNIGLNDDDLGIIHGEEASLYLSDNNFYTVGCSGACGVVRGRDGDWGADWCRLNYSHSGSRVDFVCTEVTQKNLKEFLSNEAEEAAKEKIAEINKKLKHVKETIDAEFNN